MILKNCRYFSNQEILTCSLVTLLDLISRIILKYDIWYPPKFNPFKAALILSLAPRLIPWETLLSYYFYFWSDLLFFKWFWFHKTNSSQILRMRIGYVPTKSNTRKLEGSLHWCDKNGSFLLSSKTYLNFNIL